MHRMRTRSVGVVWARCHSCGVESTMPVHQERRGLLDLRRAALRMAVCIVCTVTAGSTVGMLLPTPTPIPCLLPRSAPSLPPVPGLRVLPPWPGRR